jgi:AraC family transcriptional regulator
MMERVAMQPVIREIGERRVVGMGDRFISILSPEKTSDTIIPKLWEMFDKRSSELASATPGVYFGVCSSSPDGSKRTRDDEFFYIAGTEVESLDNVPGGMLGITIPAGRYAVFTHKGRIDSLGETMRQIHGEWLADSGYSYRAGAPELELYDERFNPQSDDSEMEIWEPEMK